MRRAMRTGRASRLAWTTELKGAEKEHDEGEKP